MGHCLPTFAKRSLREQLRRATFAQRSRCAFANAHSVSGSGAHVAPTVGEANRSCSRSERLAKVGGEGGIRNVAANSVSHVTTILSSRYADSLKPPEPLKSLKSLPGPP